MDNRTAVGIQIHKAAVDLYSGVCKGLTMEECVTMSMFAMKDVFERATFIRLEDQPRKDS